MDFTPLYYIYSTIFELDENTISSVMSSLVMFLIISGSTIGSSTLFKSSSVTNSISSALIIPVPAGIKRPMITFSFRPCSLSTLPRTAASVNTLAVSWNDAADKKESVSKATLVIPSNTFLPLAGFLPASLAALFALLNLTP